SRPFSYIGVHRRPSLRALLNVVFSLIRTPTHVLSAPARSPKMPRCQIIYDRVPGEQEHPEYPVHAEFSRVPCVGEFISLFTRDEEVVKFSVTRVEHAQMQPEQRVAAPGMPVIDAVLTVEPELPDRYHAGA